MADRDVVIGIVANDQTSRGTRSAASNFDELNRRTKKAVKEIEGLPLGAIGGSAATGFVTGFTKNISGIAGTAAPYIAAIGAAAAPVLASTLAGAIIGGAGVGGVIGGLIVASKDARVRGAASAVADQFEARLEEAGASFVQPALDGIDTIQGAIQSIDIEGIFRDSSRYVQPLAEGVSRAIEALGDGVEDLVRNAGPAVDAIADGIGDIGEAVGTGLSSLSDNGASAAAALDDVLNAVEFLTATSFGAIDTLVELNEQLNKVGVGTESSGLALLNDAMEKNGKIVQRFKGDSGAAATGFRRIGEEAGEAAEPVKSVAEQIEEAADAGRDLYDSQTTAAEGIARATRAAKENGETLQTNTEAGRENRDTLSSLARALNRNYNETLRLSGAGRESEKVAQRNRAAFIRAAEGFGLSAGKARELANRILGIPAKKATASVFDTGASSRSISAYKKQIASIPTYKLTTVEIAAKITGSSASKSALQSALNKQSLNFDASGTFTLAGGGGQHRTGGPRQPQEFSLTNVLQLDGRLIYSHTGQAIRKSNSREAWRAKVGKR